MPRKLITKQEAIRAAYYICATAEGSGGMTKRDLPGDATIGFHESWSANGKWRSTVYEIEAPGFRVYASRNKHADGRIRDVEEEVEGSLLFACHALEHYRDVGAIAQWIEKWRSGFEDHATVWRTLEAGQRALLPAFANDDLDLRIRAVRSATLLAKLAA